MVVLMLLASIAIRESARDQAQTQAERRQQDHLVVGQLVGMVSWLVDSLKAAERDELTRGSQAERRDMVALILDGAPVPRLRATRRS